MYIIWLKYFLEVGKVQIMNIWKQYQQLLCTIPISLSSVKNILFFFQSYLIPSSFLFNLCYLDWSLWKFLLSKDIQFKESTLCINVISDHYIIESYDFEQEYTLQVIWLNLLFKLVKKERGHFLSLWGLSWKEYCNLVTNSFAGKFSNK